MSNPAVARFGGSVLARLDARVTPRSGVGQAQRIPLDLIGEDPDQPRKTFAADKLEHLAASIRMVGVLQPVGVIPQEGGRYLLRWGARRCRAAALAGLKDIPAVLVGPEQAGLASQVIENAHRTSNSDSELAAAVDALTAEGMKNAEIATVLALSDPQSLKHYRALGQAREIPELAAWIDKGQTVRAIYELLAAWRRGSTKQREQMQTAMRGLEELTVTGARRIIVAMEAPTCEPPVQREQGQQASVAQQPKSAKSPRQKAARSLAAETSDPDAERVAKVLAWIDDLTRPRPPLAV